MLFSIIPIYPLYNPIEPQVLNSSLNPLPGSAQEQGFGSLKNGCALCASTRLGSRVYSQGSGCKGSGVYGFIGLGFRVEGSGFRVKGLWLGV